jgi:hypothetical protein
MNRASSLVIAMMLGCASAPAAPTAPAPPPPEGAAEYFPLTPGWKWAYQVQQGNDSILATYAVLERLGDTAIIQKGDDRLSYSLMPDGIARREGLEIGDFLLKNPIRAGASWPLQGGGEAKVAAVGRVLTVPGGTFPNCATIEETRSDPPRVARTVYAAGIGPIQIEVQVQDPSGQFKTAMKAQLVGVTKPGEDPLGAPEGKSGPPPQ